MEIIFNCFETARKAAKLVITVEAWNGKKLALIELENKQWEDKIHWSALRILGCRNKPHVAGVVFQLHRLEYVLAFNALGIQWVSAINGLNLHWTYRVQFSNWNNVFITFWLFISIKRKVYIFGLNLNWYGNFNYFQIHSNNFRLANERKWFICKWLKICINRARAGGGAGRGQGPPTFCKRIITKLRNTHFLIKGIFNGIRIIDWRTSPEHPNLCLVHSDPIIW